MTQLVAILNLTPDSFSDGGQIRSPEAALDLIGLRIEQGASIIDVGAESTRPGAKPLTTTEEWQRLELVLVKAKKRYGDRLTLSVDTRHSQTAQKSLDLGADWINDVSGASDSEMIRLIASHPHVKYVLMHSISIPADPKQILPKNVDPVEIVLRWAKERLIKLQDAGVLLSQIIFDPGIGFGKNAAASGQLLANIAAFKILEVPLLVGHSRKSFLASKEASNEEKDQATLQISRKLIAQKIEYLRVHNIEAHTALLRECS